MGCIGLLFVVQLRQVPLGAAQLHRHPRDGHPRSAKAAETNDLFLSVLQAGEPAGGPPLGACVLVRNCGMYLCFADSN